MREIKAAQITEQVRDLCLEANYNLRKDVLAALKNFLSFEESPLGKETLEALIANAKIARQKGIPLCQDTGYAAVFIEVGQDVHVTGGSVSKAVEEGVRLGYSQGCLRKSVVSDPCFSRKNTGDNTPPLVYEKLVLGKDVRIIVMPKGGGSENVSDLKMGKVIPDVTEEVANFTLETVEKAGAKACPPMVIGVGIGGGFDSVAHLAKRALLREVGSANPDPRLAELEEIIFEKINDLGIGPAGLGGRTTALGVNVETYPTHMACLPVAVNISCNALRSAEGVL